MSRYEFDIDERAVLIVIKQYDEDGDEVAISNIMPPTESKFWANLDTAEGVHVVPVGDAKEHELGDLCECDPEYCEDGKLIIHNAWDRREILEQAVDAIEGRKD